MKVKYLENKIDEEESQVLRLQSQKQIIDSKVVEQSKLASEIVQVGKKLGLDFGSSEQALFKQEQE